MDKKPMIAGFWIRFASRVLDLTLFFVVSFLIVIPSVIGGVKGFNSALGFYLWAFASLVWMIFIFIGFPYFLDGRTPSMFLLKIKIVFNNKDNRLLDLIRRELFFSLVWIINILLLITVINHTMINAVITNKMGSFNTWENFRISVFGSINSILVIFQWIFAISVIVRKDHEGLHDKFSNTKTVYVNKFVKVVKENNEIKSFKPFLINKPKIEWVGE